MCIFQTTLKTLQTEFEFLIQKLYRKTLSMFSRKDRFLHHEPKKIGVCIFLIFIRFLTIFQRFSRNPRNTIAEKSSKEVLEFTHMPLVYINHPGQISIVASIPLPAPRPTPAAGGEAKGRGRVPVRHQRVHPVPPV
jgi:hypothetical protein